MSPSVKREGQRAPLSHRAVLRVRMINDKKPGMQLGTPLKRVDTSENATKVANAFRNL
jgi:hypothetical protein